MGGRLKRGGWSVTWAAGLAAVARALETLPPDVIVMDRLFAGPRLSAGVERLAKAGAIPVVTMPSPELGEDPESVRGAVVDQVQRLLRPGPGPLDQPDQLTVGDVVVDCSQHMAWVGDVLLDLTPKEFDLLCQLMQYPGRAWTRQQMLEAVWGYGFGQLRLVSVHVANLRRKLIAATGASAARFRSPPPARLACRSRRFGEWDIA